MRIVVTGGTGFIGREIVDRLLEAGGEADWLWFHIPVGYLFLIGNPRSDWMLETVAEPGLNGRILNYPRGKVLGGSSSINAMIAMRGQAISDFPMCNKSFNLSYCGHDL